MSNSLKLITALVLLGNLVFGAWSPSYAADYDLNGVWINNDSQTGGITKIVISHQEDDLIINPFGKCHPVDCDWGVVSIRYSNTLPIEVTMEQDFKTVHVSIVSYTDDYLHVKTDNVFDNEIQRDYSAEYVLHRDNNITGNPLNSLATP